MPVFKVTIKGKKALPTYKPADKQRHSIDVSADVVMSFDVTCRTLGDATAIAMSVDDFVVLSLEVDAK